MMSFKYTPVEGKMLTCHFLNDVDFLRNMAATCIFHHGNKANGFC